jgi:hypothetical protein
MLQAALPIRSADGGCRRPLTTTAKTGRSPVAAGHAVRTLVRWLCCMYLCTAHPYVYSVSGVWVGR